MTDSKDNRSADRTLAILEAFERERRPLALRELAEYCQIPLSTCHALVHTLLNRAYLYQTGRRKDLYPTRRILDLATTIVAHDPILERLGPLLNELREETGETIILGRRHKDRVLYLDVRESAQTIRYSARSGDLKPLHSTCIGKVMLSALTPAELRKWCDGRVLERITETTHGSYARLIEDLQAGAKRGYQISRGENVADVTALAVPVSINAELVGIAVAGPSYRLLPLLDRVASMLLRARGTLQVQGIAA